MNKLNNQGQDSINGKQKQDENQVIINQQDPQNNIIKKITTHQDLMTNWLTYSQCEQGIDEIKDFEKRLECATTNLPDNEKQMPKLPPNWEKNMENQIKKKKKKI